MNYPSCPIGGFSVDNCAIRINAFLVALFLSVYIFVPSLIIIALLTLDFGLRAFRVKFTLLNAPCRFIRKCFFDAQIVDGGSKLFASRVGFVFTLTILATYLSGDTLFSQIAAAVMVVVSLLNALFDYCMGCHMHSIYHNLILRFKH